MKPGEVKTWINPVQAELDRANVAIQKLNRFGPIQMEVSVKMKSPYHPGYDQEIPYDGMGRDPWQSLENERVARNYIWWEVRMQAFYVAAEQCGLTHANFTEQLYGQLHQEIESVQNRIMEELGYPTQEPE